MMTFEQATRRWKVRKALSKYVFLRSLSFYAAVGEGNLTWIIDVEIALGKLPDVDRDMLLARCFGFTMPEIARSVHKGLSTVERRLPRAMEQAAEAFELRGVIPINKGPA